MITGIESQIPIESILIDAVLVLFPIILFLEAKKIKPGFQSLKEIQKEFGLYSDGIVDLKRTIFLFLALLFASAALSIFFLAIGITDLQKVSVEISNLQQNTPLLLGYLLIVRVAVEEFFFRGFLTKKIGALYSSIAFAILHVGYGSIAEIAGAFVLGFILAKAFEKNKTLLPNIFAHMLYNLSALLLIG